METDRPHPVNDPKPVRVTVDRQGAPRTVAVQRRAVPVIRVCSRWRVDDQWWTEAPVSRMYWLLELEGGQLAVVFQDRLGGGWYRQPYSANGRPPLP